jgi:arylsulfatase A-like enzyme
VNGLSAQDVTLPRLLRSMGYRTIHAGKAHFGAHETSGADPLQLGFDVNIAGHASGGPGNTLGLHDFSVAEREGRPGSQRSVWDVPGLEAYHGRDIFLTEALTAEVLAALRAAHGSGQPFLLNFCPYAVHAPLMANERLLASYAQLDPSEAAIRATWPPASPGACVRWPASCRTGSSARAPSSRSSAAPSARCSAPWRRCAP